MYAEVVARHSSDVFWGTVYIKVCYFNVSLILRCPGHVYGLRNSATGRAAEDKMPALLRQKI